MSTEEELKKVENLAHNAIKILVFATLLLITIMYYPIFSTSDKSISIVEIDEDRIENGIHVRTGFVEAEGLMTVVNNCTNCHSSKLVIQNRMNEERWNATIKWMQQTQNLWPLGENQEIIVNYLATNYPPIEKGRRANLIDIDWYEIKK